MPQALSRDRWRCPAAAVLCSASAQRAADLSFDIWLPLGPRRRGWGGVSALSLGGSLMGGLHDPGFSASLSGFCSPSPISFVSLARDEFNIQVLHAFVELHEFTDLNLVQALR